jgi:hypothetical protein
MYVVSPLCFVAFLVDSDPRDDDCNVLHPRSPASSSRTERNKTALFALPYLPSVISFYS